MILVSKDPREEKLDIFSSSKADQISENSLIKESTGLTFLKECMGSDNYKENESWNL
jgi:hypothetical protein